MNQKSLNNNSMFKEYFLAERFINLRNEVMKLNSLFVLKEYEKDYGFTGRVTRHKDESLSVDRGKQVKQIFRQN